MPFFPSMPADATTKQVFTAHPDIYSHWVRVSEAILRGPSPLTPAQRELIGAYVSSLNACQYCYGSPQPTGIGHPPVVEAKVAPIHPTELAQPGLEGLSPQLRIRIVLRQCHQNADAAYLTR
jgi:hypothetical protein